MRDSPVLGSGHIGLLIVDDSADVCAMVQHTALEDGRFSIVGVARDGEMALTVAERTRPDAVILDHVMPGRTGLDVLPDLRRLVPSAVIVLWSSAHADRGVACQLGATEVMDKTSPIFDVFDLLATRQHVR